MIKLALIDMPFSLPECAAFGITQIRSYLNKNYRNQVETDIYYLNHDFYDYFGEELFHLVNHDFYDFYKFDNNKHLWVDKLKKSGLEVEYFGGMLGDWIFRQEAFPESGDNTKEYFQRYFPNNNEIKREIMQKVKGISLFLEKLIDLYNLIDYEIVGFTSRFQQQTAALAMANHLKKRKSSVCTVLGGPNCEPPAGAALARKLNQIDYIFSGRRFLTGFGKFIDYFSNGQFDDILCIPGVFNRENTNSEQQVDPYIMSEEDDIDFLTELDYDSYFESVQHHFSKNNIQPILFFETSRGCSWGEKSRCTFCAIDGYNPKHRKMSPEKAIEYLNNIFNQYKNRCKYFVFVDSTLPKEYLYHVFPYINIPENALLLYEARADYTEEEVALLEKYHIRLMIVGIESLSTDALKILNKGTTAFDNIRFLKSCRKHHIAVNWNILTGIPGETDKMLLSNLNTVKKIGHLYPPTGIWLVSFQGNCEYKTNAARYDIELEPDIEGLKYSYPFDDDTLKQMTYFQHVPKNLDRARAVIIQKLSKASLAWKTSWYHAEEKQLPNLILKDEYVFDSRQPFLKKIKVDCTDISLLQYLNIERTPSDCAEKLKLSDAEVSKRIERFMQENLLFKENNKYLSLLI